MKNTRRTLGTIAFLASFPFAYFYYSSNHTDQETGVRVPFEVLDEVYSHTINTKKGRGTRIYNVRRQSFGYKRPHKLRESSAHLIDLIEKASASVQLDQAIEDIKTFANTTSFLANKLETRLKSGDVKAKKQPTSRIGKAIAAPPAPKPNAPSQQQAALDAASGGMPSAASTATSQARARCNQA